MEHNELTDEIREQLALYALDALDEASVGEWKTHLATGCSLCQGELAEIRSTLALLAYSAPPTSPPPHLKARLFERLRAASAAVTEQSFPPQRGDFSSLDWVPSEYPGVSFHILRHDRATGTLTALVKFQPGASYPAHRHPGGEDCLILQGAIRDRRGQYRAGDYVYYEPGSVHYDLEALEDGESILFVVAHEGIQILPELESHH